MSHSSELYSKRWAITAAALFCLIAAFSTLALILANGVNVPFADEWWYSTMVQKVRLGEATAGIFWSPNNEHRMLIPKVEFSVLALVTHWNSKTMMIFQWLVMVVAGALLFAEFRKLFPPSRPLLWAGAVIAALAIFFSGVQYENWLWAFQFAFFFIQTCVIVSIFAISRWTGPFWLRVVIASFFAAAASFSSAQGLLIWPALVLALILTSESKERKNTGTLFLIALMMLVAWTYFRGLPIAPDDRLRLPLRELLTKPKVVIHGFFGLVGNPFVHWAPHMGRPALAWPAGLIVTATFIGLTVRLLRGRDSRAKAAPWIALGFYGLCFCLVTVFGRLGGGYNLFFLTSRYTTHPILVAVAVLALILVATISRSAASAGVRDRRSFGTMAGISLAFVLMTLAGIGDVEAFRQSATDAKGRTFAKTLIPFYRYFDTAIDGVKSGPFYPLCPLKGKGIFEVGLEPLCRDGFYDEVRNAHFIEAQQDKTGWYRMSKLSRGHDESELVWELSGSISSKKELIDRTLFIRPAGTEMFVTAARLEPSPGNEVQQYVWRVTLSSLILSDPKIPLEFWTYDRASNVFRLVDSTRELAATK
jgi:hypothetical protein